jgi:hypothetical protein
MEEPALRLVNELLSAGSSLHHTYLLLYGISERKISFKEVLINLCETETDPSIEFHEDNRLVLIHLELCAEDASVVPSVCNLV